MIKNIIVDILHIFVEFYLFSTKPFFPRELPFAINIFTAIKKYARFLADILYFFTLRTRHTEPAKRVSVSH